MAKIGPYIQGFYYYENTILSLTELIEALIKNIFVSAILKCVFIIISAFMKDVFYNHFHHILRLFDVLPNFAFTTSETMGDYYL